MKEIKIAREAFKLAKDIDESLTADDPRFRRSVKIIHDEGTLMFFDYAFLEYHDNWVFCFTEHYRYFVYDESEVSCVEYMRIYN